VGEPINDQESTALTVAGASPLPVFRGAEMAQALTAYRELQHALDASMPEQVMRLDGKPFRKKGYWRAIAVAFNLTVEPIDERRESNSTFEDGRDNFGYIVTYRATAPNGRSSTGDGSCFAVEKARRFKCPHQQPNNQSRTIHWPAESCPDFDAAFQWRTLPAQATEHNIRSHAHTRAFNRAVSNLVGFGEVSAEEVDRDEALIVHVEPKAASAQPGAVPRSAPPAQPEEPPPPSDEDGFGAPLPSSRGAVRVQTAKIAKSGQSAKGPWSLYIVKFTDGREGKTFSKPLYEAAQEAARDGREVDAQLDEKGNIVTLSAVFPVLR
jgi:hypothetical protein